VTERDRDSAGHARNARPRDEFGRPLPRDAEGVERVPDDLQLSPEETLAEAQRLIDSGLPFNAHEVLEARWKSCPPAERDLWQGLAQLAVGLTHIQRGNARGATALLTRGADRMAPYTVDPPHGVQVGDLVVYARHTAEDIAADPTSRPEPPPPMVRRT
jgi:hypothetical protein